MASNVFTIRSSCETPITAPLTNIQKAEKDKRIKKFDDTLPHAEITGIIISLMTESDINALKVVTVNNPFSETNPSGTINSPEMGNIDIRYECRTCGKNSLECPGHYGQIELNRPIYDPVALPILPKVLSVVCHHCGNVRILYQEISQGLKKYKGEKRLEKIIELSDKKKNCSHCGFNSPNVIKNENGIQFVLNGKPVSQNITTILKILKNITNIAAEFMGFTLPSHPKDFIRNKVIAPPICTRPPAFIGNTIKQNNLTKLYSELTTISADNSTDESIRVAIMDKIDEICFNKETKKFLPKGDSQSCSKMIDGKRGIVRGYMMGKRKKHTLRTVLICDPTLKFGQVRIPKSIADYMTTSETVTQYNIDKIRSYFGESFDESKIFSIRPGSGEQKDIYFVIYTEDKWKYFRDFLSEGDIIERYLQNGDVIFLGRQPTISSSGLIGMEIVIGEGDVIGIHMSYTTPLNADFDGDEAHGHPSQSTETKVDVSYLANVKHRIMDPATNGPNFGIVYNGASSSYIMTRDINMISEDLWHECYEKAGSLQGKVGSETWKDFEQRCDRFSIPLFSTRALFSTLFPRDFWYQRGSLKIRCGIIIQGEVTKSTNGRTRNAILQSIFSQYGQSYCVTYLTYCQFLVDWYLMHYGLTIAYKFCSLNDQQYEAFNKFKNDQITDLNVRISRTLEDIEQKSTFEQNFIEEQIREYIRATSAKIDRRAKKYMGFVEDEETQENKESPLFVMTASGAKGSSENVSQIVSMVGQQLIYNQRPSKVISEGKRSTPFFKMNSKSVESQGFCKHSLTEGLDPEELFFYSMSSRVGLLDTGVNVSVTGFMQRRIVKICEDQKIQAGGEVVSVNGSVYSYQLLDNFDPRYQISTPELLSFVDINQVVGKIEQNC